MTETHATKGGKKMEKLEFYITDEDLDRLWAIKEECEKDDKRGREFADMTGNEFARYLLENELHRLHPKKP